MEKKIIALRLDPKRVDGWLKIGVRGKWEGHRSGAFNLTENDFNQMILNASKLGIDIVVDYEHATIYNPDKAPAAGWILTSPLMLKVKDGELYCKIDWTDTAKAHIAQKEYRYLSPVFVPNTADRKSGKNIGWTLHSIALTNTPFLTELDAITNKQPKIKEEKDMSKELQEKLDAAEAQLEKKDEEIKNLKAQIEANKKTLEEHEKKACTATVEAAIAEGKITEDQKDWAIDYALKDNEGFDSFLKTQKKPDEDGRDMTSEMFENKSKRQSGSGDAPAIDISKI